MNFSFSTKSIRGRNISGLGDVVEVLTEATGVKGVAEAVAKKTGKPCGCKKRKEALNKMVPFKKDKA